MKSSTRPMSNVRMTRWWIPLMVAGGASALWAAFPGGVSNVILSEPSFPSTDTSYSSARYDGFALDGESGHSLTMAGDFNGDGRRDLVVGAPAAGSGAGEVYIVYGTGTAPSSTIGLASAVKLGGTLEGDELGAAVAAADLDGDGHTDLVVGAPGANGGTGIVYVLPGGSVWNSTQDIATVANSFQVYGELEGDLFGASLSIGDVAGQGGNVADGVPELLAGAPGASKAYMIYGPVSGGTVSSAGGTNDYNFAFYGTLEDNVGASVAVAGDMNYDGSNDIILGGPHYDSEATAGARSGVAYLINGRSQDAFTDGGADSTLNLNFNFTDKRSIIGDLFYVGARVGQLGASVADVGDVNNDGFADAVLGAPTAAITSSSAIEAGRAYLVLGSSTVFDASTTWLSSAGFQYFYGETAYDHVGARIAAAGDIDQDGYQDFMVGAPGADFAAENPGNGYGAAYLVPGRRSADWPASELVSLGPNIKFAGKYVDDHAGTAMYGDATLDLNDDGYGDFFISAPGFDVTPEGNEGRTYFISFGQFYDKDEDGQSKANGDCDETDPGIYYDATGEIEVCDGKDNDCDGLTDNEDSPVADQNVFFSDQDQDGYGGDAYFTCSDVPPEGYIEEGGDCNDTDPLINPFAQEVCDSVDNDCDGLVDDDDVNVDGQNVFFSDADGDGFGTEPLLTCSTAAPEGYAEVDGDCNDEDPTVNPAATEICDGQDNDCDGLADDDDDSVVDQNTYYQDLDEDGYGGASLETCSEEVPEGYILENGDCNDEDPAINPAAVEVCDQLENDCDGLADDEDPDVTGQNLFYEDLDGDGFGDNPILTCAQWPPEGYSDIDGDCDDTNASINPNGVEMCDGADNDCDGLVDDEDPSVTDQMTYYLDADGDGYGTPFEVLVQCETIDPPENYSPYDTDCDDSNSEVSPGNEEVCDGLDNDCNGDVDDYPIDGVVYWQDVDGDGFGDIESPRPWCEPVPGYVENSDDCDDFEPAAYPGAPELCDGLDNNCNGVVEPAVEPEDEDGVSPFDQDGDSYVDEAQCAVFHDNTGEPTDCDDLDPTINPGASEVGGDGLDNDCDGLVDEGPGCTGRIEMVRPATGPNASGLLFGVPGLALGGILFIRRRRARR